MVPMRKMMYLVMIDNCEAYEDAYVYTESIWDSYDAAVSHIIGDLHCQPSRIKNSHDFMRYYDGDDIRNNGKDRVYIQAMPLNGNSDGKGEAGNSKRMGTPRLSSLSAEERAAYGLSVLMRMYEPDEVLCAVTQDACKANEGEQDVPILDDGHVTTVCYLPLMKYWYGRDTLMTMHAVIIDSDSDTVMFCNDVRDKNGLAYRHMGDARIGIPEVTDGLLETLVRLEIEHDVDTPLEIKRIGTLDEFVDSGDAEPDEEDMNTVVFKARTENYSMVRYGVDTRTFACHYLEFDFKLHFVAN